MLSGEMFPVVYNRMFLTIMLWQVAEQKEWRAEYDTFNNSAHIGRCLCAKHLLNHFLTNDSKTRQVQYAASHLWWRLHILFWFKHAASILVQVPWQVSLPVGFSTGPSAFSSLGFLRTLLVRHRYFSQFQVVTKMDDPFSSVEKYSWKAFERQRPQVVGITVDSTLKAAQSTAVCSAQ